MLLPVFAGLPWNVTGQPTLIILNFSPHTHFCFHSLSFLFQTSEASFTKVTRDLQMTKSDFLFSPYPIWSLQDLHFPHFLLEINLEFSNSIALWGVPFEPWDGVFLLPHSPPSFSACLHHVGLLCSIHDLLSSYSISLDGSHSFNLTFAYL